MLREPHQQSPFRPTIEESNEHTTMQPGECVCKIKREMRSRISQNSRNIPGQCSNNLLTDIGIVLTISIKTTEFVVNSGASMHVVSKNVLTEDVWDTIRVSRSPTTVTTVNGSIDTDEDATENVKDLELFMTVQLLEHTPALQSLGKLCEKTLVFL